MKYQQQTLAYIKGKIIPKRGNVCCAKFWPGKRKGRWESFCILTQNNNNEKKGETKRERQSKKKTFYQGTMNYILDDKSRIQDLI